MAFISKNKSLNKNERKAFIYIAETYIENLTRYVYSANEFITKRNLVNLEKLLYSINEEKVYEEHVSLLYKFRFLKESAKAISEEKMIFGENNGRQVLIDFFRGFKNSYIPKETKVECIKMLFKNEELTNKEVFALTEYVEDKLSYIFLYQEEGRLSDILNRIKMGDNTKDLVADCKSLVVNLNRNLSNVVSMNEYANNDFSLADDDSVSDRILNDYLMSKRKGNTKLKSGYWTLNQMLNGGFEDGRVYMFFGPTKGFKSGTLLNIAVTLCRYNKEFNLRDKEKTPCIVYFTQENSVKETIERLSQCIFGETEIKDWSLKELKKGLRAYTTDINGINLHILYRPNRSVTTDYLYTICDDLELKGQECICMIQDYVKRIRSSSNNPDIRIELGDVVNDFANFAKEKNIPVITAGQLNREATRLVDSYIQQKSNNYTKNLNASHIGESLLMLENTDYGIIVNREMVEDTKEEYVSFKLIASRAKKLDKEYEYFAQPISSDGGFRIEEDENREEPLAVKNIGSSLENYSSPEETNLALKSFKKNSLNNIGHYKPSRQADLRASEDPISDEDDPLPSYNFDDDDDEIEVISNKTNSKKPIIKK